MTPGSVSQTPRPKGVEGDERAARAHRVLARVLAVGAIFVAALYIAFPTYVVASVAVAMAIVATCWWCMCLLLRVRREVVEINALLEG